MKHDIFGDCNPKVGHKQHGYTEGKYGLVERLLINEETDL